VLRRWTTGYANHMRPEPTTSPGERTVQIRAGSVALPADLTAPAQALGVVVFAHGSGSGRGSPRNRAVAAELVGCGFATLLVDLLTREEDAEDRETGRWRFDVALLGERVVAAIDWLRGDDDLGGLPVGCFGASTGAAAALLAAAERADRVAAVVSRGGRPDLAGDALSHVTAPTLLIVGGHDTQVIELNRQAAVRLPNAPQVEIVAGAGHLFEEPGALERVTALARGWFERHLTQRGDRP
jgi:putative phosphoribosyl transferase